MEATLSPVKEPAIIDRLRAAHLFLIQHRRLGEASAVEASLLVFYDASRRGDLRMTMGGLYYICPPMPGESTGV